MIPILVVDADSNANFNEVLGLTVEDTLGQAREAMKTIVPMGMSKDIFIEMKVAQGVYLKELEKRLTFGAASHYCDIDNARLCLRMGFLFYPA